MKLMMIVCYAGKFDVPPRVIDIRAPSTVSSLDEGGFNEPSPEIKAPLKPQYQFEINSPPLPPSPPARSTSTALSSQYQNIEITLTNSLPRVPPPPIPIQEEDENIDDDEDDVDEEIHQNSTNGVEEVDNFDLNYASLAHAVPSSTKFRDDSMNSINSDPQRILYATIKPELPPPTELMEAEVKGEAKLLDETRESSFIPMIEEEEDENTTQILPHGTSLDFKDVEYADASESDEIAPDAMTADEAERLLSSR